MKEDDNEKYLNWPSIDPFQEQKKWMAEGIEVGLVSANRDAKKVQREFLSKMFIGIFKLTGFILSSLFSQKNRTKITKEISPYQTPWLPIWPRLSALPFHNEKPNWVQLLEENYPAIQAELLALKEDNNDTFERAVYDGFKGKPWTAKYFHLFGKPVDKTHQSCPITSEILKKIPHNSMHTCFSCIPPGGALPPHVGPTNTSLVCHLGLINCEQSAIFSGNQFKIYEEGKTLILDDSFIHGAKNTSDQPRYTLMLSFWHPELSLPEKKCLQWLYRLLSPITK